MSILRVLSHQRSLVKLDQVLWDADVPIAMMVNTGREPGSSGHAKFGTALPHHGIWESSSISKAKVSLNHFSRSASKNKHPHVREAYLEMMW